MPLGLLSARKVENVTKSGLWRWDAPFGEVLFNVG